MREAGVVAMPLGQGGLLRKCQGKIHISCCLGAETSNMGRGNIGGNIDMAAEALNICLAVEEAEHRQVKRHKTVACQIRPTSLNK